MGIVHTGLQERAWDDVGKSSQEQPHHQSSLSTEDLGCPFWPLFGCASTCCPQRPKNKNSSSGSPLPGISISGQNISIAPPSEQTIESDISIKSDTTESSAISKTGEDLVLSSQLRRFSYSDLKSSTRNFRPDSLLGEGGFGCVYKGWIDEHGIAPVKPGTGLTVAVKTLNQRGLQGHREWLAEVTFLGQLHHPNLVKLIGFCIEDDQRLLVYEFMQRGSLENHLFRSRISDMERLFGLLCILTLSWFDTKICCTDAEGALPLPWTTRMKIALGAAKGVEFLHKKSVIYRDFKTSNILLDAEYGAKLSDFGLARDGPQGDKSHVSTRVMGTYGYAAPEYVMTGHLSSKSDIYSFGVVLLELLTGKRSMDKTRPNGEQNLAIWARPYLNDRRKLLGIIDPCLEGHYPVKGAVKAGQLAHQCISRDPKVRPSTGHIVEVLGQLQDLKDVTITADSSQGSAGEKSQQASLPKGLASLQQMGKRGFAARSPR